MSLPIEELTPKQIVAELDRYIVGQAAAKRAVAVALRNRYRRQQLPVEERDDVLPKNILMMGPTGVGKTEIARRLAQLARAPFIKVEATKFTEVGYVGRDVESMVRDLVGAAVRLVEKERMEVVKPEAQVRAFDRVVEMLVDAQDDSRTMVWNRMPIANEFLQRAASGDYNPFDGEEDTQAIEDQEKRTAELREKITEDLRAGKLNDQLVEVETEESSSPFLQVFSPQGMEEMGIDGAPGFGPFQTKRTRRRVTVEEALEVLADEEAQMMIDRPTLNREAVRRAEQTGIIFLDELDKVAGKGGGSGPDVSREGVQRDLLPIIEGSTVQSKFGPVRTDHVLFIAAGAFHMAKPSDLIPELQGRLPIRVNLESLTENDFRRILREPKNALTKQYEKLLAVDGLRVIFTDEALDEIAKMASEVNAKTENIGARRLHTIMEKLLEDVLFDAPDMEDQDVVFNADMVRDRLSQFVKDIESSRYIL